MRKGRALALISAAAVTLALAAVAGAATTTIRAGNLILNFGSTVSPAKLPARSLAPIALNVSGRISTSDETHPSAFREAVVDIDRNGAIDPRGAPVCKGGRLEARNTRAAMRVCGRALVGRGLAHVSISFPEQRPIRISSPLLLFNGGGRPQRTTMFIHAFITVPVPAAIVTTVTVRKIRKGRYGLRAVAKVPVIAGGSGSTLDFKFTVQRKFFRFQGRRHAYLQARCPDGRFQAQVLKALFRNEARIPGVAGETVLKGGLVVPCRTRR